MKVIQVVGRSGSGKTPFVADLIRALRERGVVAAVKHIGHHSFELDARKDTTKFAQAGAAFSVGVDNQKTVYIARSTELADVLSALCGQGVAYTVIEGFKTHNFPKVVIGDLEIDSCVLQNPSIADVLASLDLFEEYITIPGIIRDLEADCGTEGVTVTWSSASSGADRDRAPWRRLDEVERELKGVDGLRGVRVYVATDPVSDLSVRIVAAAIDGEAAFRSIGTAMKLLALSNHGGAQTGG